MAACTVAHYMYGTHLYSAALVAYVVSLAHGGVGAEAVGSGGGAGGASGRGALAPSKMLPKAS